MGVQSFGKAIGKLIYEKRKAVGLTQTQLAEDAFGSSAKTRRISELENGTVANPHPRTIDPLIVALGIPEAEVEECARQAKAQPDPDLDRAYREARNLIDAVARHFDHENPNATFAELDGFLREKAREWRVLSERIESIEATDAALKGFKSDATEALANARFEEADACIAQAEDLQQESATLKQVRKLAELRITRASISILADQDDKATEQYLSAAEFLFPFDEGEAVNLLNELAGGIYEASRRSIKPNFPVAAALLERALEAQYTRDDPALLSKTNYRLSLIYRYCSKGSKGSDIELRAEKTIEYAREAASTFPQDGDIFDAISIKLALANSLNDKAELVHNSEFAREAVRVLNDVISLISDKDSLLQLEGHACNSLGAAIMTMRELEVRGLTKDAFDEAVDAFAKAIACAERIADLEVWGIAHANIGRALAKKAKLTEEESTAHFLRLRAIGAFLSAIETYPAVIFQIPYAQSHLGLAEVLFDHGMSAGNELSEFYLARAISSYEVAGEIFHEERHPSTWAWIQMELGRIHAIHAQFEGVDTKDFDVNCAVSHFESAIRVFERIGSEDDAEKCRTTLNKVNEMFRAEPVKG